MCTGLWLSFIFLYYKLNQPYSNATSICDAPIVSHPQSRALFFFGGLYKTYSVTDDIIWFGPDLTKGRHGPRRWSKAGKLHTRKESHNAIFDGEVFLVIGGSNYSRTQRCEINGELIECDKQNPRLDDYIQYPALFLVPYAYCV